MRFSDLNLNPIEELSENEKAMYSVTDDLFPAYRRAAGGSSRDHLYYCIILRVFELSLELDDPISYWAELAWIFDSSPLFDKSDEVEGSVSLQINDIIQRAFSARTGPVALGQKTPL